MDFDGAFDANATKESDLGRFSRDETIKGTSRDDGTLTGGNDASKIEGKNGDDTISGDTLVGTTVSAEADNVFDIFENNSHSARGWTDSGDDAGHHFGVSDRGVGWTEACEKDGDDDHKGRDNDRDDDDHGGGDHRDGSWADEHRDSHHDDDHNHHGHHHAA